jgi:hypothetical protein
LGIIDKFFYVYRHLLESFRGVGKKQAFSLAYNDPGIQYEPKLKEVPGENS